MLICNECKKKATHLLYWVKSYPEGIAYLEPQLICKDSLKNYNRIIGFDRQPKILNFKRIKNLSRRELIDLISLRDRYANHLALPYWRRIISIIRRSTWDL